MSAHKTSLNQLKVIELKKIANKCGLSTIGKKKDLTHRIDNYLKGGARTDYETLEDMLNDYNIKDLRSLIELSDDVITIIDSHY